MEKKMRIMTDRPLNAETPTEYLRSWITANRLFFDRNQGEIMAQPVSLTDWELSVEGEVKQKTCFKFEQILRMPKAVVYQRQFLFFLRSPIPFGPIALATPCFSYAFF